MLITQLEGHEADDSSLDIEDRASDKGGGFGSARIHLVIRYLNLHQRADSVEYLSQLAILEGTLQEVGTDVETRSELEQ